MKRTILLTGTSSGLGEAATRRFLADGWNVVATARTADAAAPGLSGEALLRARLDVTDAASIDDAFSKAQAVFGGVDVVVNNAGVGLGGPLEGIDIEDLRRHLDVNVVGTVRVCQAAIRHMRARKNGLIVNVTSFAGRVGLPYLSPYSAGKFAIEGLTEALWYEVKPFGIRVKLVEPGGIRSRFSHPWKSLAAYEPVSSAVRTKLEKGMAAAAPPETVAGVIAAAANDPSDRLRYTSADAGRMLRLHGLLPQSMFRALISKGFGLQRP